MRVVRRRDALRIGLALTTGVGAALVTAVVVHTDPGLSSVGPSVAPRAVQLLGGLVPVLVGALLVARPSSRGTGWLLTSVGITWLAQEWASQAASAIVFTFGLLLPSSVAVLAVHLAASLGRGRPGWVTKVVIGSGYLLSIGILGLAATALYDPASAGCSECPRNVLLLHADAKWNDTLTSAGLWSMWAWLGVAALMLVVALIQATPVRRRAELPVVAPVCAFLACTAIGVHQSIYRGFVAGPSGWLLVAEAAFLLLASAGTLAPAYRARRARTALTRMTVDLGRAVGPGGLQARLAQMLGDPELVVIYAGSDGQRVDVWGDAVGPDPTQVVTPLQSRAGPHAFLAHRPGLLDDPQLRRDIEESSALAVEYERLTATGRAQLTALRSSRARIVAAAQAERHRLERDLHDGAQQRLVSLALGLRLASIDARDTPRPVQDGLARALDELQSALADLRDLAHGIYPVALADEGLRGALSTLDETGPVRVVVRQLPTRVYPPIVEAEIALLVGEVLRRFADRQATVSAKDADRGLLIEIDLDRDLTEPFTEAAIQDIADRLAVWDGRLTKETRTVGSRLIMEVPCGS
jgi:signal transduction histidine kinase